MRCSEPFCLIDATGAGVCDNLDLTHFCVKSILMVYHNFPRTIHVLGLVHSRPNSAAHKGHKQLGFAWHEVGKRDIWPLHKPQIHDLFHDDKREPQAPQAMHSVGGVLPSDCMACQPIRKNVTKMSQKYI